MGAVYKDESKNSPEDSGETSHPAVEGSGWEAGQIHLEDRGRDQSRASLNARQKCSDFRKAFVPFISAAKVFAVN